MALSSGTILAAAFSLPASQNWLQAIEHMVPVRGGIRLQTFVYLPEKEIPGPVLYAQCQYGTDKMMKRMARFVEAGFNVVLQNIRGRLGSEGTLTGTAASAEDGYDTMNWIVSQPWCNGKIGTFGRSALARAQADTAFLAHPAHCAMCPEALPFGMMSRMGGAFMFSQMAQWIYFTQSGPSLRPYNEVDWMKHLKKLPVVSVLDELGGPVEKYRNDILNNHRNSSRPAPLEWFAKLHTPNLMVTGWYDHCVTGAFDFYARTLKNGSESQKRNTHLVVGPWDHSAVQLPDREYDFGPQADCDHLAREIAFFNRHLKGDHSGEPLAPVRIFVMGENLWRDESAWPLARAKETLFYLHGSGALNAGKPGEERADEFTYDPSDPVPTWGGANSAPAIVLPMKRGPRDQRSVLARNDVLLYQTGPLTAPLEVTGPIRLVLYAASSARDTDFTGKLMDISPDGNARILCDGMVRARFRNGTDSPALLTPGEVVRYTMDLWYTANRFLAGHRIGLAVSSSNFPRISRNLNTGGDNERDTEMVAARQTVFHDILRPSHLLLPLIK